jgi:hypothetical protein
VAQCRRGAQLFGWLVQRREQFGEIELAGETCGNSMARRLADTRAVGFENYVAGALAVTAPVRLNGASPTFDEQKYENWNSTVWLVLVSDVFHFHCAVRLVGAICGTVKCP